MAVQMPTRSVTRFFVPLIDVLILLFCIFLLMPFVSTQGIGTETTDSPRRELNTAEDPAELRRRLEELQLRLEQAQRDRQDALNRLTVRVLEIDARTGELYYNTSKQRERIATEAEAQRFITVQQREAGAQEVYFLITYPRELTGFPTVAQRRRYDSWFAGVPHSFVDPLTIK
jgi:biopolymer transport protein ExbD